MKQWEDYYKILQVHHEAEDEVIKGAYRNLAKKYHPDIDINQSDQEKMQEINRAYEVLSDKVQRAEYHAAWLGKQAAQSQPQPKYDDEEDVFQFTRRKTEKPKAVKTPHPRKLSWFALGYIIKNSFRGIFLSICFLIALSLIIFVVLSVAHVIWKIFGSNFGVFFQYMLKGFVGLVVLSIIVIIANALLCVFVLKRENVLIDFIDELWNDSSV